mgnify:CR=1 FL=1
MLFRSVAQVVLNNLYQHTTLQTGFGVILLAIDGGQPRILTLRQMLERFVAHRRDVVTRRTRFELKQARAREHILLGLQIALDHIDAIIELIRKAPDRDAAREGLMATFGLSELQAKAILEMQLQRLTGLERQKILAEIAALLKTIEHLRAILASDRLLMQIITTELAEVREKYADARRSEIVDGESGDLDVLDLWLARRDVLTHQTGPQQPSNGRAVLELPCDADDLVRHSRHEGQDDNLESEPDGRIGQNAVIGSE